MLVLAIDTATDEASVALRAGERVVERYLVSRDFHSSTVLGAVDEVLSQASVTIDSLEGIAVTVGPGSFTGLRVGIATAQGLALGAACPVVPVETLQALALLPGLQGANGVVVALDAFRGEAFFARVDPDATTGGRFPSLGPARLVGLPGFVEQLGAGETVVGNVARARCEAILVRRPDVRIWEGDLFLAGAMTAWAVRQLEAGAGVQPGELRADYGRGAHIGKPRSPHPAHA